MLSRTVILLLCHLQLVVTSARCFWGKKKYDKIRKTIVGIFKVIFSSGECILEYVLVWKEKNEDPRASSSQDLFLSSCQRLKPLTFFFYSFSLLKWNNSSCERCTYWIMVNRLIGKIYKENWSKNSGAKSVAPSQRWILVTYRFDSL